MNEQNKKSYWKWVLVVFFMILITLLFHKNHVLTTEIRNLKKQQKIIIQNQIELQAVTQLLSPTQITYLTHQALWGNFSSMQNLYLYYRRLQSSNDLDKANAFVWASLILMHSSKDKKTAIELALLNKKYQKALPNNTYLLAKKRINTYNKQIKKHIKLLTNDITNINNTINSISKSPIDTILTEFDAQGKEVLRKALLKAFPVVGDQSTCNTIIKYQVTK